MTTMNKIAFIGLGNMGGGMAANLVKAGHDVHAFDLAEAAGEFGIGLAQGCFRVDLEVTGEVRHDEEEIAEFILDGVAGGTEAGGQGVVPFLPLNELGRMQAAPAAGAATTGGSN